MKLQNGYKVIYEKIADGKRAFFADKLDGTAATQLGEAIKIGEYKLVFEKDGGIFGSATGKVEDGERIKAFDEVFVVAGQETEQTNVIDDEPEQDELPANDEDDEEPAEGEEDEIEE